MKKSLHVFLCTNSLEAVVSINKKQICLLKILTRSDEHTRTIRKYCICLVIIILFYKIQKYNATMFLLHDTLLPSNATSVNVDIFDATAIINEYSKKHIVG